MFYVLANYTARFARPATPSSLVWLLVEVRAGPILLVLQGERDSSSREFTKSSPLPLHAISRGELLYPPPQRRNDSVNCVERVCCSLQCSGRENAYPKHRERHFDISHFFAKIIVFNSFLTALHAYLAIWFSCSQKFNHFNILYFFAK